MPSPNPTASLVVREHLGQPFYEAKFRCDGQQIKRRVGPAWLSRDPATGEWRPRRGRIPDGSYDARRAHVTAARLVADHVAATADRERVERERHTRKVTFRAVAHKYLRWLETVHGAKPSTMRDHRSLLAEPGTPYRRGRGVTLGYIMAALGDRPAAAITTREVEDLLMSVSETGITPRSVNKYRSIISAIYEYGARESTFGLPDNPASHADKRSERHPGALVYYSPEEIETLARALAAGRHRKRRAVTPGEKAAEHAEDDQDAQLVRVAAYAGLRLGELLALRWRDIDFAGHAMTIEHAMSAGIESSTKSGRVRRVPLPDQAAAALDRLSRREDFTGPDELVFCNVLGRTLGDGSALRRRFKRARVAADLRPLRFHDLRHTYGSLLAAAGVDPVTIQSVMGHSALTTTQRYLHARPATDQAEVFTRAFSPAPLRSSSFSGRTRDRAEAPEPRRS